VLRRHAAAVTFLLLCRFRRAIQLNPGLADTVAISITGNTISNPDGFKSAYQDVDYIGIRAFDTASSAQLDRAHTVQNNRISGVATGILITDGTGGSVNGFTIINNSITGPFQNQNGPTSGFYMQLKDHPSHLQSPPTGA
jgi:hypothetical protein